MYDEGVVKFQYKFFSYPPIHYNNIKELNIWRDLLYEKKLIGCDPLRYGGAGFGNVSKRCPPYYQSKNKRSFFITGTQTGKLESLTPNDYTTVLEYYPKQNFVVTEGPVYPSSESMTHGALYNANEFLRYVFHTHSPEIWHLTSELEIPRTNSNVPYGTFAMVEEVYRLFAQTNVAEKKIFAMGGHEDGIVSFGETAQEAGVTMLCYLEKALVYACQ